MSVATRRASLTPSSPAVSRRSSWVDLPTGSAPSSRRGSRADLSIQTSLANASSASDQHPADGTHSKLAINQLLTNLSHVSQSQEQARMSSPQGSRSPALSDSPGLKRKFEADAESSLGYKLASASEIRLPTDPVRRASIINLATAAAAAVLQSQAEQRRMSSHLEQDSKRQRVEQLGLLIEQARKASVTSMSHDMSRHVQTASQNVAIATVLANHLGLTPQSSGASTPAGGPSAPSSPTKPHTPSALAVPQTPTTPRSPLSAAPFTASQAADEAPCAQAVAGPSAEVAKYPVEPSQPTPLTASPVRTPAITLNTSTEAIQPSSPSRTPAEPSPPRSNQALLDEAKEAAHTYSRFYRFEKEWAQKALEFERRRSSIRVDPLFNPNPSLSPLPVAKSSDEDKERVQPTSPQQRSAPESRIMSRRNSPFSEFAAGPAARTSHSVPSGSFSSSHRGSTSSLANVLSNFAELIEQRQRSCSGLEALAKQAKELPVKRLSQPNPQFRTTFGEFSWAKAPRSATDPSANASTSASLRATPQVINEADADSDASSTADRDEAASARPMHLQVKATAAADAAVDPEADAPATPRSSMSIASML